LASAIVAQGTVSNPGDTSLFATQVVGYVNNGGPEAQLQLSKSGSVPAIWVYDYTATSNFPGDINIGYGNIIGTTSGSLNIRNGNINLSGSINVTGSFTASLREGYVWVGDNTGKNTLQIATSSFGVGGGAGTSGTSGVSGTSGTSGVSGTSGTSGTSGFSINSGSFATTGSNAFSGSQYISGSIIPNTGVGTFTSSFSLGSPTNAWKDLWISEGSINFVNSLTGVTSSISLNTNTNQIVVSNLNINTASLDSRIIAIETAALSASYFSSSIQLTGSFDERYTQTSSLNTFTSSINNYTGSNDSVRNRVLQTTASLNTYTGSNDSVIARILQATASLNSKTGSFATTGSNQFNGNQTITGSLFVTSTTISDSILLATGSNLTLSSGSNLYIYNGGFADISGSLRLTGSLSVGFSAGTSEFQVLSTGVNIGNISTDRHLITGSLIVSASTNLTGSVTINESRIDNAWTSYTPTWEAPTPPAIGNGTITGAYKVIGKTCFVRGSITMGSTTTYGSGDWKIGLPVAAINAYAIQIPASLLDGSGGTGWYNALMNGAVALNTISSQILANLPPSFGGSTAGGISSIFPFTWGSGDELSFNGSYEIA
jgi:hypothetical protein